MSSVWQPEGKGHFSFWPWWNFYCHYISDITAPARSYLPTQQNPASNYQGEPTLPKLRLHQVLFRDTPYSPSAYVLYRITGADVARRITRRKEHKETLLAQTQWHDSGCDVPRGPRHWPKHCGFRGSQWGSARAAAFAQCRTAGTRRGRGVPQIWTCKPADSRLSLCPHINHAVR